MPHLAVTATPPGEPGLVASHFASLLQFETDCWDVHQSLQHDPSRFVLLDVRGPEAYNAGHIAGAINLPHGRIVRRNVDELPPTDLYIVYCAGPHCNAADRAALKLAQLGEPVKKMIGGVTGWLDEGFDLARPGSDHIARPSG